MTASIAKIEPMMMGVVQKIRSLAAGLVVANEVLAVVLRAGIVVAG